MFSIQKFQEWLSVDDGMKAYTRMQEIRVYAEANIVKAMNHQFPSSGEALSMGLTNVRKVYQSLQDAGFDVDDNPISEAGHYIGHLSRAILGGLKLIQLGQATQSYQHTPAEIYLISGYMVMNDIGCLLAERYKDAERLLIHSEIGALLVDAILRDQIGDDLQDLHAVGCYSIAAHPNLFKLNPWNGVERKPYRYEFEGYNRTAPSHLSTEVDRFELQGEPGIFLARILQGIMIRPTDRDTVKNEWIIKDPKYVLIPEMRLPEERTDKILRVVEQLYSYVLSQTNVPELREFRLDYSARDDKAFVPYRDCKVLELRHLVNMVVNRHHLDIFSSKEIIIMDCFKQFLCNLESTRLGVETAEQFVAFFKTLPDGIRQPWLSPFVFVMSLYRNYDAEICDTIDDVRSKILRGNPLGLTFPLLGDILLQIKPRRDWCRKITKICDSLDE